MIDRSRYVHEGPNGVPRPRHEYSPNTRLIASIGEQMRKPYRKETRYISKVAVHAADAAALMECMRYDMCCLESEEEAHKVMRMINGSDSTADHVVRLTRFAGTDAPPTEDRWRSFACTVIDVRHPDDAPATDEELQQKLLFLGSQRGVRR